MCFVKSLAVRRGDCLPQVWPELVAAELGKTTPLAKFTHFLMLAMSFIFPCQSFFPLPANLKEVLLHPLYATAVHLSRAV